MANLNFNGIIRGGVIRNMQVLGFGANPNPNPPGPTPLQVSTSVRLNPADTPNVSFIPTLTGNRRTFTFSAWVKRSLLGSIQTFFGVNTDTNNHAFFEFQANDTLRIASNTAATTVIQLITTQVFRDPSQWYNIVIVFDLTNATQADRVRLYINGARVTAFSTSTLPANTTTFTTFNTSGVQQYIGRYVASSAYYFGGYIADINLVDGQALTPAAFTETDSATGQLIPMTYAGTYGVNGFYLPFGNSATVAELGFNPKTTGQDYPYWPYTTLLVNTIGTNGAQNNTFLDSSTNNFTITRNGNTTQGNFSPFAFGGGTTQANGYYSGYFDGTGDYLNVSYLASNFGTGDFTLEVFVYLTAYDTVNDSVIIDTRSAGTANPFAFGVRGTGFAYYYTGTAYNSSTVVPLNNWVHLAICRSGTTLKIFQNGVETLSRTDNSNLTGTSTGSIIIGRAIQGLAHVNGYLSNLRIVKGTAVYTANFTVPTTPLTNITNTSLLTCQSSQFIDNSTNAFTITANGNSQPLPTNPFGMTAWSGYFDGTGDYLSVADNAALDMGSSNFTMECWVYLNGAASSSDGIFAKRADIATYGGVLFYINSTTPALRATTNGSTWGVEISSSITISIGTWNHLAITRSSSTWTIWVNGVSGATATLSGTVPDNSSAFVIAAYDSGGNASYIFPSGLISNARVVKGTAVYTANFTVPTAPLTAISGTSLLTCQSSTFIDNSPNAFSINVFGNSYTGTLNNPFGNPINYTTPPVQSWSTYHAASGDTLSLSQTALTALSTSNAWTIEFWAYKTASTAATYSTVLSTDVSGNPSGTVFSFNNTTFACGGQGHAGFPIQFTPAGSVSLNQWYHFAIVKNNGVLKIYINGIEQLSVTQSTTFPNIGQPLRIGNRNNGDTPFIGYVSNIRFVNGTPVYTSNFTPPTSPLSVIGNTTLLTCQSNRLVDNSFNNFVITKIGNANISPVSPFIPTQSWSAASYGGTMYFDGTGDYLTVPNNAALELGTGDFTIEGWVYLASGIVDNAGIVSKRIAVGFPTGNWRIAYRTGTGKITFADDSVNERSTPVVGLNRWVHFAFARKSGTIRAYADGVLGDTAADTVNLDNGEIVSIGANTTSFLFLGYISGLRILKGTALYTTPFVPPVLPPTAVTNTSLLLNATNAGIYDATGENVIETVGNAQVSTAVKKFGESSMYFDGTGDYLIIPPNIQNYFSGAQTTGSNKDFTIEFWFYSVNTSISATLLLRRASAGPLGIAISQLANAQLFFGFGDTDQGSWNVTYTSSSNVFTVNTWNHIAATRLGSTYRFFLNGVQIYTATPSAFVIAGDTLPMYIATNGTEASQFPFNGYIQDFRLTIGAARYQGAFTPPTAAFAYNQYDICNQQWTPTNISVTAGTGQDNLVDSPSDYGTDTGLGGQVRGNYCTWNPLKNSTTLSNGNLSSFNASTSQWLGVAGTFGMTSGQWYWECTPIVGATAIVGLANSSYNTGGHPGADANSWGYYSANGFKYFNNSGSSYGTSYTANDVIGVAFDADAGTLTFYKNGVSQGVAFSGLTSGPYFPACGVLNSQNININAGQRAFAYAAPAGFKCLVSGNLPTVNGIGATSSTQANDYFDVSLWTGADTGTTRSISGLQFAPDLWWSKIRSTPYSHQIYDSVRGAGSVKSLSSDQAVGAGAGNSATYGYLSSFGPTGVTYTRGSAGSGADPDGYAYYDQLSATYVAWAWRANGTGVANTAGTIPSTVSANTTSGCSIVTYTGTGANATVGHGLGVAPSMVIVKQTSGANGWAVYHVGLTSASYYLSLNTTDAQQLAATVWNATAPTSSVFSIGTAVGVNTSSQTYVAYCFAPINGFSAMGAYTGNGSTDGPFVYTNFRPEFVMIKCSSGASTAWVIQDGARSPSNAAPQRLFPNTSEAELTTSLGDIDILSNGFKIRNTAGSWNTNAATYIYAAFAAFPFKYARAF